MLYTVSCTNFLLQREEVLLLIALLINQVEYYLIDASKFITSVVLSKWLV